MNKFLRLLLKLSVIFYISLANVYALSINEVLERVVNNSPELRIIFEKKIQSVEDYKGQRAAYLPNIYAVLNREYQKDDPLISPQESSWTNNNKIQLIIEQRIFDLEQISQVIKYAQLIQVQEFENQKQLESLIQLAIVAYYDVIQAEYNVSVYREYLRQVTSIESLTDNMRQQGVANLADVNLVKSRLASASANLIIAQSNLDKAKLTLSYLLNLIEKNQINQNAATVLPELTDKDFYSLGDKIINVIPLTPENLLNQVLYSNLEILILRSNLCVAGYDIESQKSRYLPVVNLTGELRSEESATDATFTRYGKLTLEARYSIYDGGSREADIRRHESILKELEYQYDILVRDVSDKAFSTFNLLKSYEQQRIAILKEIESSEEVDRVYNIQFQFASRSLSDRLDNLERLSTARLKLINIDYTILLTRIDILLTMGNFVEFFGFQDYLEKSSLKLC